MGKWHGHLPQSHYQRIVGSSEEAEDWLAFGFPKQIAVLGRSKMIPHGRERLIAAVKVEETYFKPNGLRP